MSFNISNNPLYEPPETVHTNPLHEERTALLKTSEGAPRKVTYTKAEVDRKGNLSFNDRKLGDSITFVARKNLSLFERIKEWVSEKLFGVKNVASLNYKEKGEVKKLFVTVDELSKKLGISPGEVRREMKKGAHIQRLVFLSLPANSFYKNLAAFERQPDRKAHDLAEYAFIKGKTAKLKMKTFLQELKEFSRKDNITVEDTDRFLLESGASIKKFFYNFKMLPKKFDRLPLSKEALDACRLIEERMEALSNKGYEIRMGIPELQKGTQKYKKAFEEGKDLEKTELKLKEIRELPRKAREFFKTIEEKDLKEKVLLVVKQANEMLRSELGADRQYGADDTVPLVVLLFVYGGRPALELLAEAERHETLPDSDESGGMAEYCFATVQGIADYFKELSD